jgi:hypothetical protein
MARRSGLRSCVRCDINYLGLSIRDIKLILGLKRMGRKRINEDQTPARLPAGTLDRIDALLREREKRADFIRSAIERELKRREGMSARRATTSPK